MGKIKHLIFSIHWNINRKNVLAYVNSYRSGHSRLKVQLAVLKGFSLEDITDAKEMLFKEYERILGTPPKRVGSKFKDKIEVKVGKSTEK